MALIWARLRKLEEITGNLKEISGNIGAYLGPFEEMKGNYRKFKGNIGAYLGAFEMWRQRHVF